MGRAGRQKCWLALFLKHRTMKKAIIDRVVICGGLLFIGIFAVVSSAFALFAPLTTARLFTDVFTRAFKN